MRDSLSTCVFEQLFRVFWIEIGIGSVDQIIKVRLIGKGKHFISDDFFTTQNGYLRKNNIVCFGLRWHLVIT